MFVGVAHERGLGCDVDHGEAYRWYGLAGEAGFAAAQRAQASLLERGQGVVRDQSMALELYDRAARAGSRDAMVDLARVHLESEPARDYALARQWALAAANMGSAEGAALLGRISRDGLGVPADADEAMRWWLRAAEGGSAEAQYALAVTLGAVEGEAADPVAAAMWLRRAAVAGQVDAQFELARAYDRGDGVEEDPAEATRWYGLAAEQGHLEAKALYGLSLTVGSGIEADRERGMELILDAADAGSPRALSLAGYAFEVGLGVDPDIGRAVELYRRGAEAGSPEAAFNLARMYYMGTGVLRSLAIGRRWLELALEHDLPQAQNFYGTLYRDGRGHLWLTTFEGGDFPLRRRPLLYLHYRGRATGQ
ncbi:MAG TPA: sel1 repeat family protein [Candidatus Handelsmanbacteria bacterium]|nr:sel1 repeat family protein [Candidatus Handelsmanbacteria bacterium]